MGSAQSMPEAVRQLFARVPEAQLALVRMGHGYGRAKYAGTCPLTGIHQSIGGYCRELVFWTRNGRLFDGYVPSRTAELLAFHGCEPGYSSWQRWTPEAWTAAFAGGLDGLETIEIMRDARGAGDCVVVEYVFDRVLRLWVNRGSRGRSTPAQLLATLKRTTGAAFFRVA